jgi:hypothetical protein
VIEDTHEGLGLRVRAQAEGEAGTEEGSYDALVVDVKALVTKRPGISTGELTERLGKRKAAIVAAVQTLLGAGELRRDGKGPASGLYPNREPGADDVDF